MPLGELAAAHGAAVLLVTHLNKASDKPGAAYRTMGSLAFLAAARGGWLVTRDRRDGSRRLVTPIKNNLGPDAAGLAYRLDPAAGRLDWESSPVLMNAEDALSTPTRQRRDPDAPPSPESKLGACALWLKEYLADGAVRVESIFEAAEARGFPEKTLRRARGELGVQTRRSGFGPDSRCSWELPPATLF